MIKCEKLENGKYRTIFKGTIGDLDDELGALIEKFAEEVLNLDVMEMLDKFASIIKKQNKTRRKMKLTQAMR